MRKLIFQLIKKFQKDFMTHQYMLKIFCSPFKNPLLFLPFSYVVTARSLNAKTSESCKYYCAGLTINAWYFSSCYFYLSHYFYVVTCEWQFRYKNRQKCWSNGTDQIPYFAIKKCLLCFSYYKQNKTFHLFAFAWNA